MSTQSNLSLEENEIDTRLLLFSDMSESDIALTPVPVRSAGSIDSVIVQVVPDGSSQGDDEDGENRNVLWTPESKQKFDIARNLLGGLLNCTGTKVSEIMRELTPNCTPLPTRKQVQNHIGHLRHGERKRQNVGSTPPSATARAAAPTRSVAHVPTPAPTTPIPAAASPIQRVDEVAAGITADNVGNDTGVIAAATAPTHPSAPARPSASPSRGTKRKGAPSVEAARGAANSSGFADFGNSLSFLGLVFLPYYLIPLKKLAMKLSDRGIFDSLTRFLQDVSLPEIWESLSSVARGIGLASKLIQCYVVHYQVATCLEPMLPKPDITDTATCPAPSQIF